MQDYSVSIVVPVYNGEDSLPLLVERLYNVLGSLTNTYEIILVNDGSSDQSWSVILELATVSPKVIGIDLLRNYGQHNAILCGIREASCGITVTMDDDLQHPPEELPRLFEKLAEGYDVVYGKPQKEQHSFWRNLSSQITKLILQRAMGTQSARDSGPYRAFRTYLRDAFANYRSPNISIDVLLTWGTKRFASVPVQHAKRGVGESNYSFRKLMIHAINMITGFSVLPLQFASLIGFFFTLFGIGVLFYVIGRYLILGGSVPGFPFLASIIAIFSGAQLFALGIIGEYLARIHHRMMDRPAYTIRSMMVKDHPTNITMDRKFSANYDY